MILNINNRYGKILLLLLGFVFSASAQDTIFEAYKLDLPAEKNSATDDYSRYQIALILKNSATGKTIFLTGQNGRRDLAFSSPQEKSGPIEYHLNFRLRQTLKRGVSIPSLVGFLPVELLPGESTEIRATIRVNDAESLDNIIIVYSIDKALADRFGLWSGEVKSKLLGLEKERSKGSPKGSAELP